ncbi:MAG: endonuclease III [Candidatus Aenigmarchaeota archaeon]|nr:endonuclease III [Candidatus Aenigmarchaeota archaeon]
MEITKLIKILNKRYKIKPWKEKPFKVLIATILSQRTKDEITRSACRRLFKVADTPEKILKLSEKQIIRLIYPAGFYRQKAKKVKKLCKILLRKFRGRVPSSREELLKLPGVGYKTADVVLSVGFGSPIIAIDVHCNVIAKRLGIADKNDDVETVREKLNKKIPEKFRLITNLLFVEFGKDICRTAKPRCKICPIRNFCKYGASKSKS